MRVVVLTDLGEGARYRSATVDSLSHAAAMLGLEVEVVVHGTDVGGLCAEVETADGVVVGPGSPYRDEQAVWDVIRTARERGVPLVGT